MEDVVSRLRIVVAQLTPPLFQDAEEMKQDEVENGHRMSQDSVAMSEEYQAPETSVRTKRRTLNEKLGPVPAPSPCPSLSLDIVDGSGPVAEGRSHGQAGRQAHRCAEELEESTLQG